MACVLESSSISSATLSTGDSGNQSTFPAKEFDMSEKDKEELLLELNYYDGPVKIYVVREKPENKGN